MLALSKTHHAAFDAGLFTLDIKQRLHINPEFETSSDLLQRTLLDQDGEQVHLPDRAQVAPEFLDQHNQQLDWWSA